MLTGTTPHQAKFDNNILKPDPEGSHALRLWHQASKTIKVRPHAAMVAHMDLLAKNFTDPQPPKPKPRKPESHAGRLQLCNSSPIGGTKFKIGPASGSQQDLLKPLGPNSTRLKPQALQPKSPYLKPSCNPNRTLITTLQGTPYPKPSTKHPQPPLPS